MARTCLASMDSVDNDMVIDFAIMEVIKANNTRFGEGCYKNKDGKFIKSPNFTPPDLSWIGSRLGEVAVTKCLIEIKMLK